MNYLLDTHACIWAITDQEKLSSRVRELLINSENGFFVSKMSFFEIAIKLKVGKLKDFNVSLAAFIDAVSLSGFETLALKDDHLKLYPNIDFDDNHRDPFDRYLIASAHFENLAIITKDEKFSLYENRYPIIW